jgi:chromate transport protein ChrA
MGTLISVIAILVLISFFLRLLRARHEWVDWVSYVIVLVIAVTTWISDGFWMALITFFLGAGFVALMLGISDGTKVYYGGRSYSLKCDKCDYDKLEILSQDGPIVVARCKRCGKKIGFTLR